ncbi:hypothetical protein Lgra_1202 [Legionella gratiana]|uniref:Uncharacterized protein n=1 Tax=Legionella gratiana TaxID=45066 RepID=A0A378JEK1_9GAMM|nr:hypothetical protein [Legionella gratiana]KTD11744.1 hypothetical protein Lgra_1202 [Legionella gratiana]STX45421.1 Uncharacterised protein [Legionella gratiana]
MKFFDSKSKTLFITGGKTSVTDLSNNPLIQIVEPQEGVPSFYKLRRQNAGLGSHLEKHYISNSTHQEFNGNYDLNHSSNTDLEEVQNIIYCP